MTTTEPTTSPRQDEIESRLEASLESLNRRNTRSMYATMAVYVAAALVLGFAFVRTRAELQHLRDQVRQSASIQENLQKQANELAKLLEKQREELDQSIQALIRANNDEREEIENRLKGLDSEVIKLWIKGRRAYESQITALDDRTTTLEGDTSKLRAFADDPEAPWNANRDTLRSVEEQVKRVDDFAFGPSRPWDTNKSNIERMTSALKQLDQIIASLETLKERITALESKGQPDPGQPGPA